MRVFMRRFLAGYSESKKVTTILLVLLFLLTNWLSYSLYTRFDLSRTGRFRLTSATKKILRDLPDRVTLEAFFSSKVPDAYLQQVKLSKDFISEYASASNGKVRLVFMDPDSSDSSKERAEELKVPQSQITVQGEGDFEAKRIYLAAALSYGDEVEVIQNVVNTRFLEYELTSKVFRMAYPGERGIAILSGNSSISVDNQSSIESLGIIDNSLESFYGKMKPVNTSEEEIPPDVTTLFVVGPNYLSPVDQYRIDQFLMRGGNVIFCISGMYPDLQRGSIQATSPEVTGFVGHYGFTIGSDMLFEPKNYIPIRRPSQGNPFVVQQIPYPIWLFSTKKTISDQHVATVGMPGLFFPWVSSLKINEKVFLEPKAQDDSKGGSKKGKMLVLAKTSKDAWSHSGSPLYVAPAFVAGLLKETQESENMKNKGTFNVAAYAEGRFASYFSKERKIPRGVSRNYLKESEKDARIMVISTSYFMTNQFLQISRQSNFSNLKFVLAILDVMNGLEELVESRGKDVSDPALPPMEAFETRIWTMLNFLVPLLAILGFGFWKLLRRRKTSRKVYSIQS